MTVTTFAVLVAVLEFTIGLPLLVAPAQATSWMTRLVKDEMSYRLSGVLTLMLGVSVLAHEPTVTMDLAGVIRLLALMTAIKGLVICWWPHRHENIVERVMSTPARQRAVGLLALIVSVLLTAAAATLS